MKCLQVDRDIWRIYLANKEVRKNFSARDFNSKTRPYQYTSQILFLQERLVQRTREGNHLSVQDDEIIKMLKHFKVELKSDKNYDRKILEIRLPEK